MSKSEKGIPLEELGYQTALLWFDIECCVKEAGYAPEDHYRATLWGKPLAEYRFLSNEQLLEIKEKLQLKALKEEVDQLSNT